MSGHSERIPPELHPLRHITPIQVRFNDIDMFGHINNSVYFEYFDMGKLKYFEDVLGRDFAKRGFTAVIAGIKCDFFSPTFPSENIQVASAVVALGDKSLTLEQRIICPDSGDVKCLCRTVMVGFDPATLEAISIPDEFRKLIGSYERLE